MDQLYIDAMYAEWHNLDVNVPHVAVLIMKNWSYLSKLIEYEIIALCCTSPSEYC